MSKIVPVVLCGGSGTRLWPRSRAVKPKPFLPLIGDETLFEATLSRCSDPEIFAPPVIVIGEKHLPHAKAQAEAIAPGARFIVEPMGRNTAPAIALAAMAVDPSDIMLVCPSDHHIVNRAAFVDAAQSAAELAAEDWLVAFSIEATAPETGYGYIRRGEALGAGFKVASFVEKPNLETALGFLTDGRYAWNGGIFSFKADTFLYELTAYRPNIVSMARKALQAGQEDDGVIRPEERNFAAIEAESVDYAVMEHTERAATIEVAMGWSDIGNWDALLKERAADSHGNVLQGPGEFIGASGSMIDTTGTHVTVVGANNIVVVVDDDDVLVVSRDAVQRVGEARRCKA